LQQSIFKPAWWLKNPHLQTIAAKFLRRNQHLATQFEELNLPDGDFVDLAWTERPSIKNTKPIIVLLHGLEGSIDSHYAKGMLAAIKARGWIGVLMHFRGCSGRPNKHAKSYHSGDIRDIDFLTQFLKKKYLYCNFSLIGFSLGGNVVAKYLAHHPANPYQSATIICAPLHLSSCSARINQGFSKVYQKFLVNMLKANTKKKIALKLLPQLSEKELDEIKTIGDFDQRITAPINGFKDANDYYQQASGRDTLTKIKQPCLLIHAADDPFLNHQQIILVAKLPPHITFEVSKHGGHVGFISGNNPFKPQFWLEERVPKFMANYL